MLKPIAAVVLLLCATASAQVIPGVTFTKISLPPNTNPYGLGEGSDGRVWFTDWRNTQVGFVASDNSVTRFRLNDPGDPQNLVRPLEIIEGPDSNAWFTYYITNNSGSQLSRAGVAKVTQTGQVTMFPIAAGTACRQRDNRAPDCGITIGPDGALWFTQSQGKKVARITTAGQLTEFALNSGLLGLDTIATGSDGNLWVTDFFRERVWRVTPSGSASPVPSCRAPDRITSGPDSSLWMVCFQSIGKLTTAGQQATYPVVSPVADFNAGAADITSGPDGSLWYALSTFRATDGTAGPIAIGRIDPSTGPNGYALGPENGRPLAIAVRNVTGIQGQTEGQTIRFVYAATDGSNDQLYDVSVPFTAPEIADLSIKGEAYSGGPFNASPILRVGSVANVELRIENVGQKQTDGSPIEIVWELPEKTAVGFPAFTGGTAAVTGTCRTVIGDAGPELNCTTSSIVLPKQFFFITMLFELARPDEVEPGEESFFLNSLAIVRGGGDARESNNSSFIVSEWRIERSRHLQPAENPDLVIMTTPARPASWEER
jgi:streptogramin lyase